MMMIASSLMCLVILLSINDVSTFTFYHQFLYFSLLWVLILLFDVFGCLMFSTTDSDRQSTQILKECTWFLLEFRTDPNGINYKSCKNQIRCVQRLKHSLWELYEGRMDYMENMWTLVFFINIKCWNWIWNFCSVFFLMLLQEFPSGSFRVDYKRNSNRNSSHTLQQIVISWWGNKTAKTV